MKQDIWVTSDLHLRHLKVANARGFPNTEEHDQAVFNNLSRHKCDLSCWLAILLVFRLTSTFSIKPAPKKFGTLKLLLRLPDNTKRSGCTMTDERYYELMNIQITSLKDSKEHVKCPRCWHHTHEGLLNHDGLCDRCCNVMISDFPQHEATPRIIAKRQSQLRLFTNLL